MFYNKLLVHITINQIFAAVKHFVIETLASVDVKSILTILRNLKWVVCKMSS